MTTRFSAVPHRLALLLALALPFTLIACDTAEEDQFFLDAEEVEFEFEFDGDNILDPDALNEIQTNDNESLIAAIEARFSVDDVVGVRIVENSGEIRVLQPVEVGTTQSIADVFDRVRFRLVQGSSAALTVAQQSSFPMSGDRTSLVIENSSRLIDFVTTGSFSGLLDVDPGALFDDSETYLVRVTFDVVVEVASGAALTAPADF